MKKVMVFGTFDIFHSGHRHFLQQARKFGDYLIVVVARDQTVLRLKKKKSLNNEVKRKKQIMQPGLADKVILGSLNDKYAVIKKYCPEVICLGYDQKFFAENLQSNLREIGIASVKIKRMRAYKPEIYKSSKLRKNF